MDLLVNLTPAALAFVYVDLAEQGDPGTHRLQARVMQALVANVGEETARSMITKAEAAYDETARAICK